MKSIWNFFGFDSDEGGENSPKMLESGSTSLNGGAQGRGVVHFNTQDSKGSNKKQAPLFEINIEGPREYADSMKIAAIIRSDQAVIVSFKNVVPRDREKVMDFLSGVTFAVNGNVKKVGDSIFLFAPANVRIKCAQDKLSGTDSLLNFEPPSSHSNHLRRQAF